MTPEFSSMDGCDGEQRVHLRVAAQPPAVLAHLFELAVGDGVFLYSDLKQSLGEVHEPRDAEQSKESVPPHAMPQAERIGR